MSSDIAPSDRESRLSYKFQRLRERLRTAIDSGELSGKLPGERQLARKFRVNAKTLSKALTDLAAEGILHRSIGRGTFVRGSEQSALSTTTDRWLVVTDAGSVDDSLVHALREFNPELQVVHDTADLRPSFLNTFNTVLDISCTAPPTFVREMVVRGNTVVVIGREPLIYSTHGVLIDRTLCASNLARDLVLAGHRKIAVVDAAGTLNLVGAARDAAKRYDAEVEVGSIAETDAHQARSRGFTALVCACAQMAIRVRSKLAEHGVLAPSHISLVAAGCSDAPDRCTGYYVSPAELARHAFELLRDASQLRRPTTIWLTGAHHDGGTCTSLKVAAHATHDRARA